MTSPLPFVGQTQTRLLHILMRSDKPLSLEELALDIGVTKTAARQHILSLQQGQYVKLVNPDQSVQKRRGRVTYTYEISPEGRELFVRHYALFSEKMILMMRESMSDQQFKKQMQNLGKSIAADLAHKMPKPMRGKGPDIDTIAQLAEIMRDLGYDAVHSADNEITAHNCVFHQLAVKCDAVCEVDLSLMQKLTGQKPAHQECMVKEGKACRFRF